MTGSDIKWEHNNQTSIKDFILQIITQQITFTILVYDAFDLGI